MPGPGVFRSTGVRMRAPLLLSAAAVVALVAWLMPACGIVATIPGDGADAASSVDGAARVDAGGDATAEVDGSSTTPDSGCTGTGPCACAGPQPSCYCGAVCLNGAWHCNGCPTMCAGDKPRLVVNGTDVPILQTAGKSIVMNCCDSAELSVASSGFQALLNLLWRAPAGAAGTATLDLSNLPPSASVELDLGCDPSKGPCGAGTEDRYTSGFQGTITHSIDPSGPVVTYCVSVAETAGSPHPVLHSVQLYAPKVPSP